MDLSAVGPIEGALFAAGCRLWLHGHVPRASRLVIVEVAVIAAGALPTLAGLMSASIARDRVQAFLGASLLLLLPAALFTASLPAPPFTLLRWVYGGIAVALVVVGVPVLAWNARVLAKDPAA